MLEKVAIAVGAVVLVAIIAFFMAVLGGTVLWLVYPHIHSLFPTAAAKGVIAQDLSWWDSVCVTWIFSLLIKSSYSSSSTKNKQ